MNKTLTISALGALLALASCGGKAQWGVDGKIAGLEEGQTVVVEGINQGSWYLLDTLKTDKNGKFSYRHDPQGYPDIYRLRMGNESIYFPIDSIETITIDTDASSFSASARRGGSVSAANMAHVDSLLDASVKAKGVEATINDPELKRSLGEILIADPAGIVTYYIVSKQIGGRPLFNPSVALDNRLIGAVANGFTSLRPADPRTSYLKRLFLTGRQGKTPGQSVEVQEIGAFDINLYDQNGTEQSLAAMIEKGNVVVLNFTAYDAPDSPAFNLILADLYKRYHSAGLDIYQVSVDTDEYRWREAAKNLPWTTVLSPVHDATALQRYNVSTVPTTFIIDRNGQIAERVDDPAKIASTVAKYM